MKVLEHKSKEMLASCGIPVPFGRRACSAGEAEEIAGEILRQCSFAVLKAQVLTGGRGKGKVFKEGKETGGGIRLVRGGAEARREAEALLGGRLVTAQNRAGIEIDSVLVEEGVNYSAQLYLAMTVDRARRCIACIASSEGGTEIEEVAARSPEKITRIGIDIEAGWMSFHGRALASRLGLKKETQKPLSEIGRGIYSLFMERDCSLVEINPLALVDGSRLVALDAKIVVDDNAMFRQPDLREAARPAPDEEVEFEAKRAGLAYIKLGGNIGCLVNGAGLAMATMDIIKHHGGEPANFLDVGGTASEDAVRKAFSIILRDAAVKAIFVNIFGGIMRCDVIARGIVGATSQLGLTTPLVVRLEGNMVEEGRKILADSGLSIITAESMGDGAQKAVRAAGGR